MKNLSETTKQIIQPKGEPVGFAFFAEEPNVGKLEKNLALCQLFKYASVFGKMRKVSFEEIDECVVGSYVMGFGQPPEDLKDRWIQGMMYDSKIFDLLVKNIEAVPQGKYKHAVFGPLADFADKKIKPDGVLLFVNSTQAYLLAVGYFDATGRKIASSFNGHAACEIVAAIHHGKSPWVTLPCGGARGIAEAQDDELWVAMTPEQLQTTIDRLQKVGLKYPPFVYQMITSELNKDHPLTGLINREG